ISSQSPPRLVCFPYTTLFRSSLQLAPDFVLDGLWQGFRVPTLGYVERHTLWLAGEPGISGRRGVGAPMRNLSARGRRRGQIPHGDRKSTRLNSSHGSISYAVI